MKGCILSLLTTSFAVVSSTTACENYNILAACLAEQANKDNTLSLIIHCLSKDKIRTRLTL